MLQKFRHFICHKQSFSPSSSARATLLSSPSPSPHHHHIHAPHACSLPSVRSRSLWRAKRNRKRKMKPPESVQASLPEDIALKIPSFVQVGDLCALGSCSRFWRDLCGSDFLWESLARQRWPSLDCCLNLHQSIMGWRDFYAKWHAEMAEGATSVVQHVEQCLFSDSLEIRDSLKAIEHLNSMCLIFKDVELFLFRPEVNVLLNLVGLHYCMRWLEVPAEHVMELLQNSEISRRQVCMKWWKLGRLFYGFQM